MTGFKEIKLKGHYAALYRQRNKNMPYKYWCENMLEIKIANFLDGKPIASITWLSSRLFF